MGRWKCIKRLPEAWTTFLIAGTLLGIGTHPYRCGIYSDFYIHWIPDSHRVKKSGISTAIFAIGLTVAYNLMLPEKRDNKFPSFKAD